MGYADRPNWHRHQCYECGFVWEHENPTPDVSEEEYAARHLCPECGMNERWKYDGPLPPSAPDPRAVFVPAHATLPDGTRVVQMPPFRILDIKPFA